MRVTSPFGLVAKVYGDSAAHAEANAAIIDRAVNAHDDLVKALEDIRMMTDGSQSRLAKEICAACDAVLSRIQSNTKES